MPWNFCWTHPQEPVMSQPVKLSDALVLDARLTGEVFQRSIAGQVEYWARLGRAVEDSLNGRQVRALKETKSATPLSELVAKIGTPEGQRRLDNYLQTLPFPHFAAHPTEPGILIRTEQDGTRTAGRFVNRQFPVSDSLAPAPAKVDEIEARVATP
jgi:hypothetical protein